jgi:hypothetical protein
MSQCIFPGCEKTYRGDSCYCTEHFNSFVKGFKCPALPASDDVKNSKPIGPKPKTEPSDSDALTLRQHNSVNLILNALSSQAARITEQQHQITELTKGVEYLAQQVKTLVDALADEADPDAPLTTYMDGTPIR